MHIKLDEEIYDKITTHCEQGDDFMEAGDVESAYHEYIAALDLLPKPINQWEAATWILAALGDLYFLTDNHDQASEAFSDAVACPGGLGNPFIHLRLGQSAFELGNLDIAADELTRAYMGAGKEIFEDDDKKYFDFLCTKIEI